MSGETLRQAAALMRERAEAEPARGWMKVDFNEGNGFPPRPLWGVSNDAYFNPPADEDEPWLAVEVMTGTEATAEHIASWHPAVALAVADWLDVTAGDVGTSTLAYHAALTVARAYLGESA